MSVYVVKSLAQAWYITPTTEVQAASGYPAKNECTAAAGVHSLLEWSLCYSFSSCNIYYTFLNNVEHFEMYKKCIDK